MDFKFGDHRSQKRTSELEHTSGPSTRQHVVLQSLISASWLVFNFQHRQSGRLAAERRTQVISQPLSRARIWAISASPIRSSLTFGAPFQMQSRVAYERRRNLPSSFDLTSRLCHFCVLNYFPVFYFTTKHHYLMSCLAVPWIKIKTLFVWIIYSMTLTLMFSI